MSGFATVAPVVIATGGAIAGLYVMKVDKNTALARAVTVFLFTSAGTYLLSYPEMVLKITEVIKSIRLQYTKGEWVDLTILFGLIVSALVLYFMWLERKRPKIISATPMVKTVVLPHPSEEEIQRRIKETTEQAVKKIKDDAYGASIALGVVAIMLLVGLFVSFHIGHEKGTQDQINYELQSIYDYGGNVCILYHKHNAKVCMYREW